MSDSLWKNYGIVKDGVFYFNGGPLGVYWHGGKSCVLVDYLVEKAKFLRPEFAPFIANLKTYEPLIRANNKMTEEASAEQLQEWEKKRKQVLFVAYNNFFVEHPYFDAMLQETSDLELVFVSNDAIQEYDWSIGKEVQFGRNNMYIRENWLKEGNTVGEILTIIRDIRKPSSSNIK